jgi:hypothetical protein
VREAALDRFVGDDVKVSDAFGHGQCVSEIGSLRIL